MDSLTGRLPHLHPEIQLKTFLFLDKVFEKNVLSYLYHSFIIILISLNVLAVILETIQDINERYEVLFNYFEVFSVTVFSIEYLTRLWACSALLIYQKPIIGRFKFMLTPMAVIDLVAILPFYIPMLLPMDTRFFWILRIFRLFRLFKLGRYSESFNLIVRVVKSRLVEVAICLLLITTIMIFTSAMMYHIEHQAQPEVFSSIPATMWWCVITLTTVGYGDVYPVTPLGKILGSLIALSGIGLFALPTGILASGFSEELQKRHTKHIIVCPHCGKALNNNHQ